MMRSLVRGMIVAALVVLPQLAQAQSYPSKPVKLIVPFPAGGPADTIARVLTEKMAPLLGQPIILENRGGAGGVTGIAAVAKAEPDGYTIGLSSAGPLAITPALSETMPYDVHKDLKLLTQVVEVPELLVVADNVPVSTYVLPPLRQVKKPAWLNDVTNYHDRGNIDFNSCSQVCFEQGDFFGLDDLFTEKPAVMKGLAQIYSSWITRFKVDGCSRVR